MVVGGNALSDSRDGCGTPYGEWAGSLSASRNPAPSVDREAGVSFCRHSQSHTSVVLCWQIAGEHFHCMFKTSGYLTVCGVT